MRYTQEQSKTMELKSLFNLEDLDPRIKLIFIILFTTTTFVAANIYVLIWNYILMLLLWLCIGKFESAIKIALVFTSMIILQLIFESMPNGNISGILLMILIMAQRLLGFVIMTSWFTSCLCINDFVTALNNMKVPTGITISLAVMFRYLPTVKQELKSITNTMKLRNININFKNMITHPFRTIEYVIVPLILRTLVIADQLSASVMTRGFELEGHRSSYRTVKIQIKDITILVIVFALLIIGDIIYGRF